MHERKEKKIRKKKEIVNNMNTVSIFWLKVSTCSFFNYKQSSAPQCPCVMITEVKIMRNVSVQNVNELDSIYFMSNSIDKNGCTTMLYDG